MNQIATEPVAERGPYNGPPLVSIDELLDAEPKRWLVKRVLGRAELAILFGPPSSGKSFVAMEFALSVAEGAPLFGCRIKGKGPVLFIAAEGAGGLGNRLKARRMAFGLTAGLPIKIIQQPVDLSSTSGLQEVLAAVKRMQEEFGVPPVLIIVDTLARCFGGGDENSSEAMANFIGVCDELRRYTGATILVCHHTGKDTTRGARGHSSLKAAVDAEIAVKQTDKVYVAKLTKAKDGAEGHLATYRLKKVELGKDEDGDLITSCVVETIETGTRKTKTRQCELAIGQNPHKTDEEIARIVGCDRSTVTRARTAQKLAEGRA